jgi:hypothetical protein
MLFDLRGRRRRAVQATYLTLALLMGGGLVFFGIGSDVSGGLFDVFGERGGSGTDQVQQRIERNEERLQSQPNNERLLAELVRDYYAQAGSQLDTGATQYPEDARDELQKAGSYWNRYLQNVGDQPDPSLASVALQVFDVGALNRPKQAQEAARIIAEADNSPEAYLRLVSYAALAGDTRTADLAAQKAVDLAPKAQKKEVRQQAEQLKTPAPQQ